MKEFSVSFFFSCIQEVVSLIRPEYFLLVSGCCLAMLLCGGISIAHARFLSETLSLFELTDGVFQPQWSENGAFSGVLKQDSHTYHINYLEKQTNVVLNNTLNKLKKKIRITFNPKVIIKPFVIAEDIHDMLVVYRTKRQRKDIHIDNNFQAKLLVGSQKLTTLKKISKDKSFSVCPYRNKIYGLHLQITW